MAAPTPTPQKVASEMGVSRTRSAPKRSSRPWVVPKMPPVRATSSPITNTAGSRSISWCMASLSACTNVISRSPGAGGASVGAAWGA